MRNALLINGDGSIGRTACRTLLANDWRVIATCRSEGMSLPELGVGLISGDDVASPSFVRRVSSRLKDEVESAVIDMLVVNCELSFEHPWGLANPKMFPDEHQANETRVLDVVNGLLPHLRKGGRVVVIAGCVLSVSMRLPGEADGYRVSRLAAHTVEQQLIPELSKRGISAVCVLPKLLLDRRYDGSVRLSGAVVDLPACRTKVVVDRIMRVGAAECAGFSTADGRPAIS